MSHGGPDHAGVDGGPGPSRGDDERLAQFARELATATDDALAGWVRRCVEMRAAEAGMSLDGDSRRAAEEAGELARVEVCGRLRDLLDTDIDDQTASPLQILRTAVAYPTAVLRHAGVPPVERDEFARRGFPGDDYDLTPSSFADIDPSLHEPGIRWGAAKAHVHLARRRSEGRR